MATILVDHFTDPACPWAWSAEPALLGLRWHYGEQLEWTPRMVVLSERAEDYEAKGFTTDRLSEGLRALRDRFGMPIDARERPRMMTTAVACRAVVAARERAPEHAERLLRELRVRTMAGDLTDERETLEGAARDAGLDARRLRAWMVDPEVERAVRADMDAARHPLLAALVLDHKLAGWEGGRRYTCPSLVLRRGDDPERPVALPGFQPPESYEAALANLAPELERAPAPAGVDELLDWAPWPLATREVAALCGLDHATARERLVAAGAEALPLGSDALWAPAAVAQRAAA